MLFHLKELKSILVSVFTSFTVSSPIGSPSSAASLLRGMAELSLSRFSRSSRSRSQKDLQRTSVSETGSVVFPSDVSDGAEDLNSIPTFLEGGSTTA